jgi:hypothetical protein
MNFKTSLATSLLLLLLLVLALDRAVEDTKAAADGPTVYGRISVSVDHVSTR